MKLGLGIDTGGTYTDSVIYDFDTKQIITKAKALTTKEDLTIGIIGSLVQLSSDVMKDIELVSLSTTLATNACVEGKGSRGKLVLLGYDEQLLPKLRSKYGLPDISEIILIPGSHGQQGQVISEPDWLELEKLIRASNHNTDAYGVAEYWGIRNPAFEQEAKKRIRQWTSKPVVCAHELSGEINSLRRASTTLLNARLITLIEDLLDAVKVGISKMGISAPIMIVKGDGTMMSESFARERPVETLLSGPAASVIGGMKLTGCRDALILDIGGTTSDLAVIRDGMTVLSEEGVDVGTWRTGTKAINIKTIGLGGDSIISFDKNDNISIGPRKAAPLSWIAQQWPEVKKELRIIRDDNRWHTLSLGEFFYLISKPDKQYTLSEVDIKIITALESGPKSLTTLAELVEQSIFFLETENLEKHGIIGRGALTPSDLMHITGDYKVWDTESAQLGAEIMANRLKMSVDTLIKKVNTGIVHRLYDLIVQFLLVRNMRMPLQPLSKDALAIVNMGFEKPYEEIQTHITTTLPIIGIGAPAHIFLKDVAAALGTEAMISSDAGVANALGAITGSIIGEEVVLIRPRYDSTGITGYGCHASTDYYETEDYEEAIAWAKQTAIENAKKQAEAMGASNIYIEVDQNNSQYKGNGIELLMETIVIARGIGNQAIFSKT
ncbi:MAG: hydantoinase/oxoprolinase family protein [Firmicutes bacterium]|nr:hydantoinase/oxoprolinase family protein [Bacillota bacterium]